MTEENKRNLFLQARAMKFYEGIAVPIELMATKIGVSELEIIEGWKWIIDSGYDRQEGFCLEFTNDYTGLTKKLSFDAWVQDFEIYKQLIAENQLRMRMF